MTTIKFKKNNKTFSFSLPSSWAELKEKDLLFLADCTASNDRITATIQFFCYHNKIKILPYDPQKIKPDMFAYALKFRKHIFFVADRDIRFISTYLNWIYPDDETNIPMPNLIELPLKPIRSRRCNSRIAPFNSRIAQLINKPLILIPPEKALTNLTFSQFCHADSHFQNFIYYSLHQKKYAASIEHMNKMIAALFILKGQKFNASKYFNHLPVIEKLSMNYKTVVYWYFMSCKKILLGMFPKLMSASDSKKKADNENDNDYQDPFKQYMKLQSTIVKSPAELEIIKHQSAWEVFDYLETQLEDRDNSRIVH